MKQRRVQRLAGMAVAAGMLFAGIIGYCNSPGATTGAGVLSGQNTQLDRVSALSDGQTLQAGAEALYSSAAVQRSSFFGTARRTAVSEAELYETDTVLTWTPVYTKASSDSSVIYALLPGTVLTNPAQEEGQDWYEVYVDGLCGFVPAEALARNADLSATLTEDGDFSEGYGTLLAAQSLYAAADSAGAALCTLDAGEGVELLQLKAGWYYVRFGESYGYLPAGYVLRTESLPTWRQEELDAEAEAALRAAIVATAQEYLGCKYKWAAAGSTSFDCSGFTMYIMNLYGISLPHSAAKQCSSYGTAIEKDALQPGDLVFFSSNGIRATHVGIYIGDGSFIHASSSSHKVIISSLDEGWYSAKYFGACTLL